MQQHKREALIVFALLAFTYGYFYQDSGGNGNSRFGLTFAMVREGRLTIDSFHDSEGTDTGDKSFYDGHYYSDKAIGTSLLGAIVYAPMYWLMKLSGHELTLRQTKYALTLLVIGLPSAVAGSLIYVLGRQISKSKLRAYVAALAIMLGTMCLPFSALFFGHQLAAALLLCGFFLIFQLRLRPDLQQRRGYLFLIGFLLGFAFLTEYTTAVIILPLAVYYLWACREKGSFRWTAAPAIAPVCGGLIPVVILMVYNMLCFGNPFSIGYSYLDSSFQQSMSRGLMGINWPQPTVLFYLTFHPTHGLFWQSPVLLLAFVGAYYMSRDRQHHPEASIVAISFASYLLINSGYFLWWGGASFGPRHLIPALPFLALPLVYVPRRLLPLTIVLGLVSVAQMFMPLASMALVRDDVFSRIRTLGFFEYSTIYSFCLQHLLRGWFAYNLGEKVLGLRGWMILLPNVLAILAATAALFISEVRLPRSKPRAAE